MREKTKKEEFNIIIKIMQNACITYTFYLHFVEVFKKDRLIVIAESFRGNSVDQLPMTKTKI